MSNTYNLSSKTKRKGERKQKRSQHMILRETGILCIDKPTKNIVICNAGLVSGLTEEALLTTCLPYGIVRKVVMLPGQSFCFVQFDNSTAAEHAFKDLHGKVNLAQNDGPLYLTYSESVPEVSNNEQFRDLPSGLKVIADIVSTEQEKMLLKSIDWSKTPVNASLKYRQVKHYGYEFCYDINNVHKDEPLEDKIPFQCDIIWETLKSSGYKISSMPDQLTVNKYNLGQGIPPHIDTHSAFESPIYSLSLGSDSVMEFRHPSGRHCSVLLPQRSLLIMDGEARYVWTHGITPRTMDIVPTEQGLTVQKRGIRTSFTFRTVLRGECECSYKEQCDSRIRKNNHKNINTSSDKIAAELEATHVHDVYENIATHFSDTRHKPWPNVLEFVSSIKLGGLLIDVGCGNGKYLGQNKSILELGCDRSFNLACVCKERGFQIFTCDCLQIPVRDSVAEAVISIAVIHHLATEERRIQAVSEMVRILIKGGRALIYVWAKDQAHKSEKSSYLKQRKHSPTELPSSKVIGDNESASTVRQEADTNNLPLPVHRNRTQFQHQDVLVPWKLKPHEINSTTGQDQTEQTTFLRYYHVFEENELENMCTKVKDVNIIKSYYDQGNWCVILEKNS